MSDSIPIKRNDGWWHIHLYNPPVLLGPYKGYLFINKEFHIISEDPMIKKTIINIPSQNVAYVEQLEEPNK